MKRLLLLVAIGASMLVGPIGSAQSEGAGDLGPLCEAVVEANSLLEAFQMEFSLTTDADIDDLFEKWSLALIERVVCVDRPEALVLVNEPEALVHATETAFEMNREVFEAELVSDPLSVYGALVAGLMMVSSDLQSVLSELLGLGGTYLVVTCTEDACAPTALEGLPPVDTASEPYSGAGDPDGDGLDNATEAANVLEWNCGPGDSCDEFVPFLFAEEALHLLRDGKPNVVVDPPFGFLGLCRAAPGMNKSTLFRSVIGDILTFGLLTATLLVVHARRRVSGSTSTRSS